MLILSRSQQLHSSKVTRDELMKDYDQQFPGYDFAANAGYGTAKHLVGLEKTRSYHNSSNQL